MPERAVAEGLVEALDAAARDLAAASSAPAAAPPAAASPPASPTAATPPAAASPPVAGGPRAAFPFARVLVARADEGRDVLIDALRERGAHVPTSSRSTRPSPSRSTMPPARRQSQADYVLFTSASSVRFFAAAGGALQGPRLASIGPATSAELRGHGAEPDLEADPHTPDGLGRRAARGRRIVSGMSLGQPREHHATIGSTNERARELAEGVPPTARS